LRIPEDYFLESRRESGLSRGRSLRRTFFLMGKNILGVVFVLAGLAMLILPGQGLLTILIGLFLSDFPGKRGLEKRLVRNKRISGAVNYIRKKGGKAPLKF